MVQQPGIYSGKMWAFPMIHSWSPAFIQDGSRCHAQRGTAFGLPFVHRTEPANVGMQVHDAARSLAGTSRPLSNGLLGFSLVSYLANEPQVLVANVML